MFRADLSNGAGTEGQVTTDIRSIRTELDREGQAIRNSQGIAEQIRSTNTELRQTNYEIKRSIGNIESVSRNDKDLINEGRKIIIGLPETK